MPKVMKAAKAAQDQLDALILFKGDMGAYVRLYTFLSQIFDYGNTAVESAPSFTSDCCPCWISAASAKASICPRWCSRTITSRTRASVPFPSTMRRRHPVLRLQPVMIALR